MGSKPTTVKQVIKGIKTKPHMEKSIEKSSTNPENPNCELLLAYYASEPSMNKKIKSLYEVIFAHEELEIYEINLSYTSFDVKCTYHLKIILHYFVNIQELKLSKIGLNSKNLKRLSRGLPSFKMLSGLYLDGNRLDIEGIEIIVKLFKFWVRLKILNLEDNELDTDSVCLIARNIGSLPDLKILHLGGNRVGDRGVQFISDGLCSCYCLHELYLASSMIRLEGAKKILCANSRLRKINLSDNQLSRESVFLLASKYSDIELIL